MLEIILIISCICVGVHVTTREDCIFKLWQKVVRDPETWNHRTEMFHPITECLVCMSSFWTCAYLGYLSNVPMLDVLSYISVLLVLLVSFCFKSKIIDKAAVFFYLLGVFAFLLDTGFGFSAFIILFGVAGANAICGAILKR